MSPTGTACTPNVLGPAGTVNIARSATLAGLTDTASPLLPSLPEQARAVRRAAFGRLRAHRAATVATLASDTALPADVVGEALAALVATGTATVDETGQVVAVGGLSIIPAGHELLLDGDAVWTWCAFDGIGIPAALGVDALARTRCGHCATRIDVIMAAGAPSADGPVVGWLPGGPCGNVQAGFCPQANLFCDPRHLREWRAGAGDPPGQVATLTDLAAFGAQVWAEMRPPTPGQPDDRHDNRTESQQP